MRAFDVLGLTVFSTKEKVETAYQGKVSELEKNKTKYPEVLYEKKLGEYEKAREDCLSYFDATPAARIKKTISDGYQFHTSKNVLHEDCSSWFCCTSCLSPECYEFGASKHNYGSAFGDFCCVDSILCSPAALVYYTIGFVMILAASLRAKREKEEQEEKEKHEIEQAERKCQRYRTVAPILYEYAATKVRNGNYGPKGGGALSVLHEIEYELRKWGLQEKPEVYDACCKSAGNNIHSTLGAMRMEMEVKAYFAKEERKRKEEIAEQERKAELAEQERKAEIAEQERKAEIAERKRKAEIAEQERKQEIMRKTKEIKDRTPYVNSDYIRWTELQKQTPCTMEHIRFYDQVLSLLETVDGQADVKAIQNGLSSHRAAAEEKSVILQKAEKVAQLYRDVGNPEAAAELMNRYQ